MKPKRIAIVGGGISGLTAAYYLAQARRAGAPLEEHLFEAKPCLGGVVRTEKTEGCLIEAGPDSFLTEKAEAIELCERLGLVAQLIGSEDHQRKTWILHKGKLVPLPEGFQFLVPAHPWSVIHTPLLSLRSKLALVSEVFTRPRALPKDESVASFLERHFGCSLVENVVDPLLAAVYGGKADRLSAPAVLPRLVEIERQWGSLIRGLRHAARARKKDQTSAKGEPGIRPPLFTSLHDGLETLVAALRMNLEGERVICGRTVVAVTYEGGEEREGVYSLKFEQEGKFSADAVILALPARAAARLLGGLDHSLSRVLFDIHYSSSMIVTIGYDASRLGPLPTGFGFLVPRKEKKRIRACTFVGQKFAARVPANRVVLRCFLGGMHDEAVLELSHQDATATVREELEQILGISVEPLFVKIYRWPKAMAQYTLGHQQRMEQIGALLAQRRNLFLCGNAYQGIGIPDCIRSGRLAAENCLRQIQEN